MLNSRHVFSSTDVHSSINKIEKGQVPVQPATYYVSKSLLINMDIPHDQTPGPSYRQHTFTREDAQYQMPIFFLTQYNQTYETPVDISHVVKFLSSSISFFSGTEKEDISSWLDKIEAVATNYNL